MSFHKTEVIKTVDLEVDTSEVKVILTILTVICSTPCSRKNSLFRDNRIQSLYVARGLNEFRFVR